MIEKIVLRYVNERLQIGMVDIRTVYLLSNPRNPLISEVYKGRLVYRERGSTKRISYQALKKGLVKRALTIEREVPDWL